MNTAFPMRTPVRRAGGFTLLDLMISMTIGLLLTVVAAQVFVGSRRTHATTDDVARMQENMRFAHDVLSRMVRMASYVSAPAKFPIPTDGYPGIFGGADLALEGEDGAGTDPDEFTVRYNGTADLTTTDCLGKVINPGEIAVNRFFILKDTATRASSLACSTGGDPQILVPDVENMQILYGEETTGDFTTDRWVNRTAVTRFDSVIGVRIALLFRTPNLNVRSVPDAATKHKLLDVELPVFTGDEATRIRRVMTLTLAMRNRSP